MQILKVGDLVKISNLDKTLAIKLFLNVDEVYAVIVNIEYISPSLNSWADPLTTDAAMTKTYGPQEQCKYTALVGKEIIKFWHRSAIHKRCVIISNKNNKGKSK